MRRLVASTLTIACVSLATGCGALGEALARNNLGELRTVEGAGFSVELPCDPAESDEAEAVGGVRAVARSFQMINRRSYESHMVPTHLW